MLAVQGGVFGAWDTQHSRKAEDYADGRFRVILQGNRTYMRGLLHEGATLTYARTGRTCSNILALEAAPV